MKDVAPRSISEAQRLPLGKTRWRPGLPEQDSKEAASQAKSSEHHLPSLLPGTRRLLPAPALSQHPGGRVRSRRVSLKGKAAEITLPGCAICSQANATASREGPLELLAKKKSCERHGGTRRALIRDPRCIDKRFSASIHVCSRTGPSGGRVPCNFTSQTRRSSPCTRHWSSSSSQHVGILHAEAAPATAGFRGLRGHG